MSEEINDDPFVNKERFKNRRRMAWVSLLTIILLLILIFMLPMIYTDISAITSLKDLVETIVGGLVVVILTYMGSTTAYGIFSRKKPKVPLPPSDEEGKG